METCECEALEKSGGIVDGIIQLVYVGKCKVCKSGICPNCGDVRLCRRCFALARLALRPEVLQSMSDDQLFECLNVFGIVLVGRRLARNDMVRLIHAAGRSHAVARGVQWQKQLMDNPQDAEERKPKADGSSRRTRGSNGRSDKVETDDLMPTQLSDIGSIQEMSNLNVRQLKQILTDEGCQDNTICDKSNLVQLVADLWSKHNPSAGGETQDTCAGGNMSLIRLSDIRSTDDIRKLSVGQLKRILAAANCEDNSIFDKVNLVQLVKKLWLKSDPANLYVGYSPHFGSISSEKEIAQMSNSHLKQILRDCQVDDVTNLLERIDVVARVAELFVEWKISIEVPLSDNDRLTRDRTTINIEWETDERTPDANDQNGSASTATGHGQKTHNKSSTMHNKTGAEDHAVRYSSHFETISSESSIRQMSTQQLKAILIDCGVNCTNFLEKADLVAKGTELFLAWKSTGQADSSSDDENPEVTQRDDSSNVGGRKNCSTEQIMTISNIPGMETIEHLSEDELRIILLRNNINCGDGATKWTMAYRVLQLWHTRGAAKDNGKSDGSDDDGGPEYHAECSICWEKEVESTFLECGHATTCMACAVGLEICPICREKIVRVIRIYRS